MSVFNCPSYYTNDDLIDDIIQIRNLKILNCYNCPLLTSIPFIKGLDKLYCTYCYIKSIPFIEELNDLTCAGCPLKSIPLFKNLVYLNCSNCPLLQSILIF